MGVNNANKMSQMFEDCMRFNFDLRTWVVSSNAEVKNMLKGCVSYKG